MSQNPSDAKQKAQPPRTLGGFFKSLTDAVDDVVNEVKADLKAMTPPDAEQAKKAAERDAQNKTAATLIGQSTSGTWEETFNDANVPALEPEPDESKPQEEKAQPTGLPPGNLWQALTNPLYTNRLRTDACFHALTSEDIENYRRGLAAETKAPFTMGLTAIILQAPLEEDLEEGGTIVGDDLLLLSLLKSLEETRLYGSIGAGPRQIWPNMDALDEALTTLLNAHPKLIALGPLGIDEPFAPYQLQAQKDQLALQLDIAADFNLPVILSQRSSIAHMNDVLSAAENLPPLIWLDVLTAEEDLAIVQKFNMSIVLRPELTNPSFSTSHLYRGVPATKRLLASGSALIAPHGFSGHFNQPKFLQNTLASASKALFIPEAEVTAVTNRNLAALFQK